jgi:hypothetical protein
MNIGQKVSKVSHMIITYEDNPQITIFEKIFQWILNYILGGYRD